MQQCLFVFMLYRNANVILGILLLYLFIIFVEQCIDMDITEVLFKRNTGLSIILGREDDSEFVCVGIITHSFSNTTN